MQRNPKKVSVGGAVVLMLVMLNAFVLEQGLVSKVSGYLPLLLTVPLLLLSLVFRNRIS
ncbi:hypothetical protein [Paracnuella aquatica]|uniref:hypothetical protein n=1 Tax=Paracnuella aquatica TaxID=2268757 RepID=UPI0012D74260|nr:hypothetical protein [Paracnuella aquatica]